MTRRHIEAATLAVTHEPASEDAKRQALWAKFAAAASIRSQVAA